MLNNQKVRFALLENNMKQWELAELLDVSESVLSRKLRNELPDDEQERIVKVIREREE